MKNVFITLTEEEAFFYKPDAPLEIKAFVVLTVRNSPIETLQSEGYKKAGLDKKISDEQLRKITSEAIAYFSKVNLDTCFGNGELSADEEIIVQTLYSNWKIIVNGQKNYIWLYHKNTYNRSKDRNDLVPGYHSQSIRKSSLMGYFTYIAEHDTYRLSHPDRPKKEQENKKLNKHEVKKRKKREHYQSVMRVLALLENEANYRQMQAAR